MTHRRGRTPTEKIERSPTNREMIWYKAPSLPLRNVTRSSTDEWAQPTRFMRQNERRIHTHNQKYGINHGTSIPSILDVDTILKTPKMDNRDKQTEFIAVRSREKVVGYTVYQLNRKKLEAIVHRAMETGKYRDEKEFLRQLRAEYVMNCLNKVTLARLDPGVADEIKKWMNENMGITLRFVPNRKEGYSFHDGQFIKN
jgi:hypothetical protein